MVIYPDQAEAELRRVFPRLVYVPAVEQAAALGEVRAANVILLGRLSAALDLPLEAWHESLRACVKPQFLELNLTAFKIGRDM